MKKIKYSFVALLLTLGFFSFGQSNIDSALLQKTESVQISGSNSNKVNPQELRKEKDSIAKNLAPPPDKAIVYIIRNRMGDWAIPYRMDIDSFQMGWVKIGTYVYTVLEPGEHVLICTPPGTNECRLTANLEAGKIYFVEITFGIGIITTKVILKKMDEGKGRKNLLRCDISKSNQFPLFPKSKDVENFPPDEK